MVLQSVFVVSTRLMALAELVDAASVAASTAAIESVFLIDFEFAVTGLSTGLFDSSMQIIVAQIGMKAIWLVLDATSSHCDKRQTIIPENRL